MATFRSRPTNSADCLSLQANRSRFVSLLVTLAVIYWVTAGTKTAVAQSGFVGQWCAQGDRSKPTSIAIDGPFYKLTNEQGSTATGNIRGNVITAMEWQLVRGTLSGNGSRIDWDNGTFWAKCNGRGGGGGGGGHHDRIPNLQGTWYRDGNRSKACSIQQNGSSFTFTNEFGQTAQGKFLESKNITANWGGTTINGTLTRNEGQINWGNGTTWSR